MTWWHVAQATRQQREEEGVEEMLRMHEALRRDEAAAVLQGVGRARQLRRQQRAALTIQRCERGHVITPISIPCSPWRHYRRPS